jgi:succinylglutamate desuccinylase/aspartoacylase family protein
MPSLATLRKDLSKFARYHLVRRAETYPARETELGIVPLPFDLDRYVETVRAFDGPSFEVSTEATVTYRDRAHPILSVRSRGASSKTLLVLAGVHGNEHAGLLAVPPILEAWREEGARLVVVTPVNPVGAAELSRFNAEGYDVNRDFVRFGTPEARLVRDIYERERPDFVISLHEGPQDATFMFTNRFVAEPLARALCDALAEGGTVLAEKDYFGLRLDPPGLSPSSASGRALTSLWAGVLKMKATIAYSEDRRIPEIVLESSWRVADEAARVRPHVDLVAAVAQRI